MRKAAIIAVVLLLCGWGVFHLYTGSIPKSAVIGNLEGGRTIALGHGGMGTRSWHGLNTFSSFRKALETGADGTEMDVQLTADGILVAFHDEFTGEAKCPHHIAQHTYTELKACLGEMPTVNEVLALGWPDGSVFSFDVKLHGVDAAHRQLFAEQLRTVRETHPQFRILIESSSPEFLSLLTSAGIGDGLYLYASDATSALKTCTELGLEGVSIRSNLISAEEVAAFHSKGLRVMLWGVGNRWHNREAVLKGADIIQSDRLGHLVSLVKE